MSLLLVALLQVQDPPTPSREERVLALLQEVGRSGSYRYWGATFPEVEPRLGNGPVVVPAISVFCGNTDTGTFDDVVARKIASECLRIYGFEVSSEHQLREPECRVRLDGVDIGAKVGFELVGRGCHEEFCEVQPEEPEVGLEPEDARWLAQQGYRLHVADVALYSGYGDELTPTLAYVAGLVRFLNEATEGEDVLLDGLLFPRERAWELRMDELSSAEGVAVTRDQYNFFSLRAAKPVTLRLHCRGAPDLNTRASRGLLEAFGHARPSRGEPLTTTRGAPAVLLLHGSVSSLELGGADPEFCLRLRQTVDGIERTLESPGLALFATRDFDLLQPFELELELVPEGRYWFRDACIGAAARP